MAFAIIQLISRIISLGALIASRSGSSASEFSISRMCPGSRVSCDNELAKHVYSASTRLEN